MIAISIAPHRKLWLSEYQMAEKVLYPSDCVKSNVPS